MRGKGENRDSTDVLRYAFWNINGYNSKIIGNKLINQDFLQVIGGCDVIGLAETHIHTQILDDLVVPGFVRVQFKNRKPHSNGKCGSGGIALFCKKRISKFVVPFQNDNKYVI